MSLRFSHIVSLLIVGSIFYLGCKGTTTDPNGTNNTHTSIGDSIPRTHSNYSYLKSQLDLHNNVIANTPFTGTSFVDTVGISTHGKDNVFFIFDEDQNTGIAVDTSYYFYEANGDLSIYLENPGFLKNHSDGEQIDEPLKIIANLVFHNWITLPVASKQTLYPYDGNPLIDINGAHQTANIHTVVEFIGDTSIATTKGTSQKPDTVAAKHCRITIVANMILGTKPFAISHVRDIWFVPKIGYIANQMTRTNVPADSILIIPLDTTATLKVMTNYTLF